MKFKGELKLRSVTPQGMEYRAEVKGLPLSLNVFIPESKNLQAIGEINIDIPEVEEPKAAKPRGKK